MAPAQLRGVGLDVGGQGRIGLGDRQSLELQQTEPDAARQVRRDLEGDAHYRPARTLTIWSMAFTASFASPV